MGFFDKIDNITIVDTLAMCHRLCGRPIYPRRPPGSVPIRELNTPLTLVYGRAEKINRLIDNYRLLK